MNMISTVPFLAETDASTKQAELVKTLAAAWEKKNSKAARAGGVSLMALSLAACGGSDDTPYGEDDISSAKTTALTDAAGTAHATVDAAITSNDSTISSNATTAALTDAAGTVHATVDAAITSNDSTISANATTAALTDAAGTVHATVDAAITSNDSTISSNATTAALTDSNGVEHATVNAAITSNDSAIETAALTDSNGVAHASVNAAITSNDAAIETAALTDSNGVEHATVNAAITSNDSAIETAALTDVNGVEHATVGAAIISNDSTVEANATTAALTGSDGTVYTSVDQAVTSNDTAAINAAVAADTDFTTLADLVSAYDALVNPSALNSLLSTADNIITGTANADTVGAVYKNSGTADTGTLNLSDSIAGGDGTDTFNITAYDEMTAALMPVLNSFETVTIQNALSGIGAHTGVSSWAPNATTIQINGAQATEVNGLAYATQEVTLNATSGDIVLDGTGTAATVNVAGVTGGELSIETATSATLNVTADSTIDDITSGGHDAATLTINGSGALTLSAVADASVTTINAAGNTGGVSISGLDFSNITSVTGTAQNDTFGTTGAIVGTDVIAGGDGTDTLEIATAITAATLVTGIENVTVTGVSIDYEMEVDGATAITFATDGTTSGGADVETGTVSDYDGSATITVSDVNIDDTSEDDEFDITIEAAEDAAEGDADTVTLAIVTTQTAADGDDYIIDDINYVDEASGAENWETFAINVSGTRGVTIEAVDLSDQGDTPVVNVNTSVALAMSAVSFETQTNGDDLGNTLSFAGSTGAVTYTAGDLAYSSDSDDVITGGSGSDTLSIDLANDAHSFTLSAFETITVTDSNAGSLDLVNASGYTTINLDGVTTGNGTLDNVASGTTVVSTTATTSTVNIDGATAGSTATLDFSTAHSNSGDFTFGEEFTTVNFVVSAEDSDGVAHTNGDADDTDTIDVTFDAVTSLTVNVTGADVDDSLALDFDIAATTTSVAINSAVDVTMDGSSDTYEDDINVTFAGSTGAVSFTAAAADIATADTTFVGGSGSTDTIIVTFTNESTAATVSGFETLQILDSNGGTVDMDDIAGVSTIDLADVDAGAVTLNNVNGETVDITTGVGAATAINIDSDTDGGGTLDLDITLSIANIDNIIDVTDFASITIDVDEDQDAFYMDLDDDDVDTITFNGDSDIVFSTSGDMDVVETINIFNAGNFDTGDTGNSAVDTNFNLHSDNVDVDLDLGAGTSQTITFGSTLDTGDVVTITGFLEGSGVNADVLDLSALGLSGVGDLTFTDSSEDASNAADDSVTITSSGFSGSIVLIGTDSDTVLTADLSSGTNFIF